jgi:hypothetical protein
MSDVVPKPELLPVEPAEPFVLSEADRNRPIWEVIAERVKAIPEEELEKIPHDGAVNHDHYLYGAAKKESA